MLETAYLQAFVRIESGNRGQKRQIRSRIHATCKSDTTVTTRIDADLG